MILLSSTEGHYRVYLAQHLHRKLSGNVYIKDKRKLGDKIHLQSCMKAILAPVSSRTSFG